MAVGRRSALGARRRGCWRSSPLVTWQARPVRFGTQRGTRAGEGVGFTHLGCVTWALGVVVDGGGGILTVGGRWGRRWVVDVGDRWRSLAMAVVRVAASTGVLVVVGGGGGWAECRRRRWWMGGGGGKKAGDVSVTNNRIWRAAARGPSDVIIRPLIMWQ